MADCYETIFTVSYEPGTESGDSAKHKKRCGGRELRSSADGTGTPEYGFMLNLSIKYIKISV